MIILNSQELYFSCQFAFTFFNQLCFYFTLLYILFSSSVSKNCIIYTILSLYVYFSGVYRKNLQSKHVRFKRKKNHVPFLYMFKAIKRGEYTQTHNLTTRSIGLAQPIFHRLTTTQHAISFTGPTAWNNLSNHMRSIEKIGTFKRTLKAYLISNYQSEEN